MKKIASGAVVTALAALLTPAWGAVTDAQATLALPFQAGETVGDPVRSVVYLLDRTASAIVAIDTSTGRQVRRTALTGAPAIAAPNYTGSLAVTPGGTILWVALASAHKLQGYALPNLNPAYSLTLAYEPGSVACNGAGVVFVGQYHGNGTGVIHALNPSSGAELATLRPGANYWADNPQLVSSPSSGARLYAVDGGLTGSQSTIYEYDLTNAAYPQLNTYPAPQQNLQQLVYETASNRLYTAQGGLGGITTTALLNQVQSTWQFTTSTSANGVASQSSRLVVYGLSADRLYGFNRGNGALIGELLPPGTNYGTVPRSLCVTGSDKATYLNGNSLVLVGGTRLTLNQAPVLVPLARTLPMNGSLALTFPTTDAENDPTAVRLLGGPAHGTLQGTWPTVTYVPTANWYGTDSILVMPSDSQGDGTATVVSLNVVSTNHAPTIASASATLPEDGSALGQPLGQDADNDTLTYSLASQPAHGVATIVNGLHPSWTYKPAPDYFGSDSFLVRVTDPYSASATATISLTITPVNDPSISSDQTFAGTEDTVLTGRLAFTDVDSVPQFSYTSPYPTHGSLSLAVDGTFTYTPFPDWNGTDSFGFYLVDQGLWVGTFTATLNIAPVNDAPIGYYQVFHGTAGVAYTDQLQAFDVEGSPLTFTLVDPPVSGSIDLHADGSFTAGSPGAQYPYSVFTYTVSDGAAVTDPLIATVWFDIPASSDQTFGGTEDTALNGTLTALGAPGATLQFSATSQPAHGTLTLGANGALNYSPAADWNGSDSFTFTVSDGTRTSSAHTATLAIAAVDDAPVSSAQSFNGTEDAVLNGTLTASDIDSAGLSFAVASQPAHGTLNLAAGGAFGFTPAANWNGSDAFSFTVSDGTLTSGPFTATLTLAAVNDAPTSSAQSFSGTQDTVLNGQLAAADAEGDNLGFTITAQPAHGTLSLATGGGFSFTPASAWYGSDSFSFTVSDGQLTSGPFTATLAIARANHAPVGSDAAYTTAKNTDLTQTLAISDPDGDALTLHFATFPQHGTMSLMNAGWFIYHPNAGYVGPDSFSYTASDGRATSGPYVITLSVIAVNHAPTSSNQTFSGSEDTALNAQLSAADSDGDAVSFTVATRPVHGSLTSTAGGAFTFTPAPNWNGSDSFTFTVSDGTLTSGPFTATLTLAAVNDAPLVNGSQAVFGTEDITLSGQIPVIDLDGDSLSYTVITQPVHGSLTVAANGAFTFAPAANWNGIDGFTFTVSDGTATSGPFTMSLSLSAVNDAPVSSNQGFNGSEDAVLTGTLTATDVDSSGLTFSATTLPAHGTLSFAASGTFSFTPAANWNGSDSFTFKLSDGALTSGPFTATLTLAAVDDPPTSGNQAFSGSEDSVLNGVLNATDVDSGSLAFSVVGQPAHGVVAIAPGGAFSFTPATDWNGSDSFTFSVSDGTLTSGPFTATVTLAALNDAPASSDQNFNGRQDTVLSGTLRATDVEGDGMQFTVVGQPAHGALSLAAGGAFSFTPATGWYGSDGFTFTVGDGLATSAVYTATLSIAVSDAPVSQDQTFTGTEDGQIFVHLAASDADGDTITYAMATQPQHGTLAFYPTTGDFDYRPAVNWNGTDSFTFTVSNGTDISGPYVATLIVTPVNDTPTSWDQQFATPEDTVLHGALLGNDIDGDALVFQVTWCNHGQLQAQSDGTFTYTPDADWNGTDRFSYYVGDYTNYVSGPYTATITVTPVNDAPTAGALSYTGGANQSLTITPWLVDVDGEAVSAVIVTTPAHGSVSLVGGKLVYQPAVNYTGIDSFRYAGNDGKVTGASALASVQVTGAGLPVPWSAADLGTVGKTGSTTFTWSASVFTVNGAGAGFTAKSDAGQLLSQSIAGNYQLSAQVLSQSNTASSAQAGIQMRASNAVGAVDVFLYKTPSNAVYVQYRTATGGATTSSLIGTYASPWLMLQRSGSTVTAYVTTTTSGGAPVWGTAKKTISITLPSPGLGGLAVSSWTTATLGAATFGTVTVTPTGGG